MIRSRPQLFLFSMLVLLLKHNSVVAEECIIKGIYPADTGNMIVSTLEYLAADERDGRVIETCGSAEARAWLIYQLELLGVSPAGTNGFIQTFSTPLLFSFPFLRFDPIFDGRRTGHNIIGIYYPEGTEGMPPKILLSAHYDGINDKITHCHQIPGSIEKGYSEVCNAAVDNATGVGIILDILVSVKEELTSPVAIAFWDGEEDKTAEGFIWGLNQILGSGYFAKYPSFDSQELALHVNMESIGYDLFPNKENHIFIIGDHSGGEKLRTDVASAFAGIDLEIENAHYGLAQTRTDLQGFIQGDWEVPYLVITSGPGSTYHTNADQYRPELGDKNPVNIAKAQKVADAIKNLTFMVNNQNRVYPYEPIGKYYFGLFPLLDVSFETHALMANFAKEALDSYGFLIPRSSSDDTPVCDPSLRGVDRSVCRDLLKFWKVLEKQSNDEIRQLFWPANILGRYALAQKVDQFFKLIQKYSLSSL